MYKWLENVDQPYIRGENQWLLAILAATLGEKSRGVTLLQDAFRNGHPYSIDYHRYHVFYPLHGFPEFEDFMKPKR